MLDHHAYQDEWSSADSCVSQRFTAKKTYLKFSKSGSGEHYRQEMTDKTDVEHGMTISTSYSRQAVNNLCETIMSLLAMI